MNLHSSAFDLFPTKRILDAENAISLVSSTSSFSLAPEFCDPLLIELISLVTRFLGLTGHISPRRPNSSRGKWSLEARILGLFQGQSSNTRWKGEQIGFPLFAGPAGSAGCLGLWVQPGSLLTLEISRRTPTSLFGLPQCLFAVSCGTS